jgi:hypothetical protein
MTMPDKRDWLHLCNEFAIPNEDFEMQHCARCFQSSECTRSQHGKGKFDERVANWEQRLFTEVPRMDESDPRFRVITAQKFVEIDPGPTPEVGRSAWVDPRDLQDTIPEYEVPETKQIEAATVADLEEQGPTKTPKLDEPEPEPQVPQRAAPVVASPMNTPNQPGQMVGNREKPSAKTPPADPWESKETAPESKDPVVKPGARIRFDGSGV